MFYFYNQLLMKKISLNRYTPLLAFMLLPNLTISPLFGKCLFSLFDLLAGYLIYIYVKRDKRVSEAESIELELK